jgi:hypothetical protein
MSYCEKCDWEYEEGECLCPGYKKFMEAGFTSNVPMAWKTDYWDGYPNAPEFCNHVDFEDYMDGSATCKLCGTKLKGLA